VAVFLIRFVLRFCCILLLKVDGLQLAACLQSWLCALPCVLCKVAAIAASIPFVLSFL